MTSVYVVAHKNFDYSKYNLDTCYKVIRVGAYSKDKAALGISDGSGDNISKKNPNYCELTALYWIWKNDNSSEIKGLCHYRRYFTRSRISTRSKYFISQKDIELALKDHDAIVAENEDFSCGTCGEYLKRGYQHDLDLTKEAISKLYPEYIPTYEKEIENGCGLYGFNMLIAPKEIFNAYCEWLFNIMPYVEEKVDLTNYTQQEARIYGFISERLLRVWVKKNELGLKEYRVVNTEEKRNLKFYTREFLKSIGLFNLFKRLAFKYHIKSRW